MNDLETKKTRRLSIDLTDLQLLRLKAFADEYDITVNDILSNYIADLVKVHSNGSDERLMAEDYFQRTHLAW